MTTKKELAKTYDAKSVDKKWYTFWEKKGLFAADPASDKPKYCISMPPPNVTGALHMGHALVNTIQDTLIRWKRMSGFETLWVPGTDHAGIATQTVVERQLIKTTGKRRKDFSRQEFLEHVWDCKEKNEGRIIEQIKALGCSCDWNRLRFTMDHGCNLAVKKAFKTLFDKGLIYRGDYLVNWDPVTQTALADDEVEYEERNSFLWHLKYPLKDGSGHIHIATTRPETMLGDTAIAVSPKDERHAALIGKTVMLPLVDREIPIIADRHVDPEFGTGMVKVTPAHDPNDYQMGLTHDLPFVNIMTPDGKINENGAEFVGMSMAEARDAVVKAMKGLGLLEKIEPHVNRVGVSYRSKATIEPYMSKQWFVKIGGFADDLRAAVKQGHVKLIPKHWENTYTHWIDNLRDWCISRQLWWGHRIPIWYKKENPEEMICYEGEGLPPEVAADPEAWEQDEDVLDTWFSSSLWPFSNLGWPDKTPELNAFYPNSVLVTGHDILFFWVARMIFMGDHFMEKVPFPESFLHGLIYAKSYWRDAPGGGITYVTDEERRNYDMGEKVPKDVKSKWEKMSKTKGNIIDPLEVIDTYGTDAIRMALCASSPQSREIDLDRRRFDEFRNFANKIWNGARFVFMNLEGLTTAQFAEGLDETLLSLEDRWILSVLNRTIRDVNSKLENYTFDQAAMGAYDFFWKEFCANYVEIAKPVLFGKRGTPEERLNKQKMLVIVLCQAIRLIHPMAPFITEELFQELKSFFGELPQSAECDPYTTEAMEALRAEGCIVAPYPKILRPSDIDQEIESAFETVGQVVYTIRNIRGEMNIPPSVATDVHIVGPEADASYTTIANQRALIAALVRTKEVLMHTQEPEIGFACSAAFGNLSIKVPLPTEMFEKEKTRLEKEKEKLLGTLERTKKQLANEEFTSRAPPHLVDKQRQQQQQAQKELTEITAKLASM